MPQCQVCTDSVLYYSKQKVAQTHTFSFIQAMADGANGSLVRGVLSLVMGAQGKLPGSAIIPRRASEAPPVRVGALTLKPVTRTPVQVGATCAKKT